MLPFGMATAQTSPNAYSCDLSSGDSSSNGGNNVSANNRKEALACGISNNVRPSAGSDGEGNMAVGMFNNIAAGGQVVAVGYENAAGGVRNALFGVLNKANSFQFTPSPGANPINVFGTNNTIIGVANTSGASSATIIGRANQVYLSSGPVDDAALLGGVAVGSQNFVVGIESIAIGTRAEVGTNKSQGVILAATNYAIAIGSDTTAELHNSVAIGSKSSAKQVNTGAYTVNGGSIAATGAPGSVFSVGNAGFERQVQNVAAGVVSATSTDAVNGSQLYAVGTQVNRNTADISSLSAVVDDVSQQSLSGVALALSMGGAVLPPGKDSAISVGLGTYEGESAFSASALYLLNPNLVLSGGIGGTSNDSNVGARVGLTFGW
jgi:hypothetical protein